MSTERKSPDPHIYRPLIPLDKLREHLSHCHTVLIDLRAGREPDEIMSTREFQAASENARQIAAELDFEFEVGELIQYREKDGSWINGVIVAYMQCYPSYVVTAGDCREPLGKDAKLYGLSPHVIRLRG